MKNKKVDTEVKEWAESKECSKSVCLKVATHVNKYQLRELKEWLKAGVPMLQKKNISTTKLKIKQQIIKMAETKHQRAQGRM